jgi:hypothetical protein
LEAQLAPAFYAGIADFLQSSEQSIRLQTSLGGGIGRYLKSTTRTSISVMAGLAWQGADYSQSINSHARQNTASGLIATSLKVAKFDKTNLNVTATVFPAISDPGRIHLNANAAYYVTVIGRLKWNMSFYGNWDTRPPATLSGSDYGSSTGLTWTFGNE